LALVWRFVGRHPSVSSNMGGGKTWTTFAYILWDNPVRYSSFYKLD
jgi:hypothetical protein